VQRLRCRYAQELALLPAGAPTAAHLQTCFNQLSSQHAPAVALRILRQLVFERLVVMDCCEQADLSVIDPCHDRLGRVFFGPCILRSPTPINRPTWHATSGERQRSHAVDRWHGQIGARELNVLSDIDLIYVYDEDGETTGARDASGVAHWGRMHQPP
jgi:glutamate-ammonia-ligase adenylyltransferase